MFGDTNESTMSSTSPSLDLEYSEGTSHGYQRMRPPNLLIQQQQLEINPHHLHPQMMMAPQQIYAGPPAVQRPVLAPLASPFRQPHQFFQSHGHHHGHIPPSPYHQQIPLLGIAQQQQPNSPGQFQNIPVWNTSFPINTMAMAVPGPGPQMQSTFENNNNHEFVNNNGRNPPANRFVSPPVPNLFYTPNEGPHVQIMASEVENGPNFVQQNPSNGTHENNENANTRANENTSGPGFTGNIPAQGITSEPQQAVVYLVFVPVKPDQMQGIQGFMPQGPMPNFVFPPANQYQPADAQGGGNGNQCTGGGWPGQSFQQQTNQQFDARRGFSGMPRGFNKGGGYYSSYGYQRKRQNKRNNANVVNNNSNRVNQENCDTSASARRSSSSTET